ncbi:pyocin activator PrtN family protein [Serratia fonticola]|uniref:pyocin activator PrtN family protein n=1 Tax=Serratia fonticola TaxID=47917 RepID=UPI0009403BCB|nr:pyocin activator PrtN family protein [Serratia fonticola]OKP31319.1 pyocin activator protein PrtN [Serratia fonticola]
MNTMFLLMAEFGTTTIKLSDMSERFLGMSPAQAEKKAAAGELPIVSFRVGNSQKAPRLVHIQDLAEYIDQQINDAKTKLKLGRCPFCGKGEIDGN